MKPSGQGLAHKGFHEQLSGWNGEVLTHMRCLGEVREARARELKRGREEKQREQNEQVKDEAKSARGKFWRRGKKVKQRSRNMD